VSTHPTRGRTSHRARQLRVLVAEATADPTLSTPERWQRHGLEPILAHDAMEALRHFRDDAPGLVVLDDRLPGFELSGLVRILHASGRSSVPVILVTHAEDGAAAAEAVGADGFIQARAARGRLPEAIEDAVALNRGNRK
jgi:DNA-binding NtrC family response regulator